jgi:LPS export ABC transporter protein LptC
MKLITSFTLKTLFVILAIVMASCENDIKVVQALGKRRLGVEEGTKIEAYQSQAGKLKARLTAPLMYRYLQDTERVEFPKSLHVDFYDSSLKVESQLYASYGQYFENDKKVFLRDSVIVFNVKKDTLWCKELYWDQFKQEFYTDKPVHLSQNSSTRQILYGRGLRADQNFKWFVIDSIGKIFNGNESLLHVPDSSY